MEAFAIAFVRDTCTSLLLYNNIIAVPLTSTPGSEVNLQELQNPAMKEEDLDYLLETIKETSKSWKHIIPYLAV